MVIQELSHKMVVLWQRVGIQPARTLATVSPMQADVRDSLQVRGKFLFFFRIQVEDETAILEMATIMLQIHTPQRQPQFLLDSTQCDV
jgi:hypothetical protein